MITLGLDLGRWLGWALLDGSRYLAAGVIEVRSTPELVERLLVIAREAEIVSIERPEGIKPNLARVRPSAAVSMAAEIAAASWIGGGVAQAFRERGRRVVTCTADDVRAHFIDGRAGAKGNADKLVALLCQQQIAGWPRKIPGQGAAYRQDGSDLLAEHRCHVADAGLAALFAPVAIRRAA